MIAKICRCWLYLKPRSGQVVTPGKPTDILPLAFEQSIVIFAGPMSLEHQILHKMSFATKPQAFQQAERSDIIYIRNGNYPVQVELIEEVRQQALDRFPTVSLAPISVCNSITAQGSERE